MHVEPLNFLEIYIFRTLADVGIDELVKLEVPTSEIISALRHFEDLKLATIENDQVRILPLGWKLDGLLARLEHFGELTEPLAKQQAIKCWFGKATENEIFTDLWTQFNIVALLLYKIHKLSERMPTN